MIYKLKRTPGIYVTGFMGSGKSTVAHALADRLGWDFIDLDARIEEDQHTTIAKIFETQGEAGFRHIETEALKRVMRGVERGTPAVIALGGGAFVQPENFAMLDGHGVSIWLDCPLNVAQERVAGLATRPLARDPEAFRRLYEDRRTGYSRADYRIDADCEVTHAVDLILKLPFWK